MHGQWTVLLPFIQYKSSCLLVNGRHDCHILRPLNQRAQVSLLRQSGNICTHSNFLDDVCISLEPEPIVLEYSIYYAIAAARLIVHHNFDSVVGCTWDFTHYSVTTNKRCILRSRAKIAALDLRFCICAAQEYVALWLLVLQEPRHQVTLLCFLATFTAYMERVGFSIAYTAMARDADVSEVVKGTVLSAFYWGYGISQVLLPTAHQKAHANIFFYR